MIECAHCGRLFPEVVGAPTQACPHCGHEFVPSAKGAASSPSPASATAPVDAFGALAFAARTGRRVYPKLLLVFLPALAIELVVGFATDAYAAAAGIPADVESLTTGQQMQLLGVALPLLIALYTVRFALWAFVARVVLAEVGVGGPAWRKLLPAAALMGFVLTLTFIAGLFLVLVGFLVFLHWFAYAPAQLSAGAPGVGAAFDRSRRFAQRHRTYGYTALMVLVGLAVLIPYFLTDALGGAAGVIVPAIINWVGGPLVPLLAASYVALARGPKPEPKSPPEPSSPSVRSSTKCPQCATLIPYTSSGAPVDVTCPACGYTGKVL